ncbi:MAG: cadmium-translocating P-type ATPase [Prevotella sp.]|nr:cadmium-translocating P-type ATPase [Prevotella sp.]
MHGQLWQIGIAAVLLVAAVMVEKCFPGLTTWQLLLVYLVPYLVAGHGTLREAAEGIAHGDMFNEHFLMSVATIGALLIGFMPGAETEFPEAVFVMLFFLVGELFEEYAEGQSRQSIAQLMDVRPDVAHLVSRGLQISDNGEKGKDVKGEDVSPEQVAVGSIIEIRPGEKVPLDGTVIEGATSLDTAALTGESMPRDAGVGDTVLSGCINLSGVIRVRTTKEYGESTVAKIIRLVENAGEHKSRSEAFITRFARVYTPVVVLAALALAIIPPLFSFFIYHLSFSEALTTWLHRALIFLVVSCPCALVISVPLTFFAGIGGASRRGILVKGANYMDVLAKVDTVVFDKTGTLTQGQFAVEAVHSDEPDILHLAAHVEHHSTHPIGAALREAYPDESTDGCVVSDVTEVAGHGVRAKVGTVEVCVGNEKMMEAIGAKWTSCEHDTGTIVHVAIDGSYAGHIITGDTLKTDSAETIRQLRQLGVRRTVMLTGDHADVATVVADNLGIDEWHAGLLPADKADYIDSLQTSGETGVKGKTTVAFVGDGINDAPVLARADVGIAMGGLGSDAAIEAADVVIMDDKPSKVATAIAIARRTLRIARENVVMAIGVKVAVLLLATVGLATMWMAVFADVGVTVLAVMNAMRALRIVK